MFTSQMNPWPVFCTECPGHKNLNFNQMDAEYFLTVTDRVGFVAKSISPAWDADRFYISGLNVGQMAKGLLTYKLKQNRLNAIGH